MKSFFIASPNKLVGPQKIRVLDTQQLPSLNIGGWGDPHMYIRLPRSLNPNNYTSGRFLAKWGDNKAGTSGLNEILLVDLETVKDKIQIYYTNKQYNSAKAIVSMRVVRNGVSTTYTNTAYVVLGPVVLSIIKLGSGASSYMNFELNWPTLKNVRKLSGSINLILKRVAASNNYFDGKDGLTWDGYGFAGQIYGLSRGSFETNTLQNQSADLFLAQSSVDLSDEDFGMISEVAVAESSVTDDLNDNDTNDTVDVWDPTVDGDPANGVESSLTIMETFGTLDHYLANLVSDGVSVDGMNNTVASTIINDFIDKEVSNDYYMNNQGISNQSLINKNIIP